MSPEAAALPVRVAGVSRRFGASVAVEDVSFEVRPGEMFGLIGPDGAGKTTTLKMVLGLLSPDAGEVVTCGLRPRHERRALSHRVGYLSQRFSLYGDLSVDENIGFFAEVHGVRNYGPQRDALLERVRMGPFRGRLAARLSGGMKQKLALACTLIHTPELLVLDEPTTGVDPVSRRDFWKLLARLQRECLTILLTTPYLDEAERCERVALMDGGRLLVTDRPAQLRRQARGAMVDLLVRPRREALERLRQRDDVVDVQTFGERLHVTLAAEAEDAARAEAMAASLREAGLEVEECRLTEPTLEDVFIQRLRSGASRSPEMGGAA